MLKFWRKLLCLCAGLNVDIKVVMMYIIVLCKTCNNCGNFEHRLSRTCTNVSRSF